MKIGFVFLIIVFLGSYFFGSLLESDKQIKSVVTTSDCNLLDGNCHIVDKGIEYEVSFHGVPSPLTAFEVHFTALKSQPSNVEIKFEMEEMDMGNNFYSLENKGKYWAAQVLLPVCSLGRNDWVLYVNAGYSENNHATKFMFSQ